MNKNCCRPLAPTYRRGFVPADDIPSYTQISQKSVILNQLKFHLNITICLTQTNMILFYKNSHAVMQVFAIKKIINAKNLN